MKIGGLFVGQVLSRQENVSCRLLIRSGSVEKPSEELVPLTSLGKPNVPPLAFPLRLILSEAYRNIEGVQKVIALAQKYAISKKSTIYIQLG